MDTLAWLEVHAGSMVWEQGKGDPTLPQGTFQQHLLFGVLCWLFCALESS